jgi:hypothetical protein
MLDTLNNNFRTLIVALTIYEGDYRPVIAADRSNLAWARIDLRFEKLSDSYYLFIIIILLRAKYFEQQFGVDPTNSRARHISI